MVDAKHTESKAPAGAEKPKAAVKGEEGIFGGRVTQNNPSADMLAHDGRKDADKK